MKINFPRLTIVLLLALSVAERANRPTTTTDALPSVNIKYGQRKSARARAQQSPSFEKPPPPAFEKENPPFLRSATHHLLPVVSPGASGTVLAGERALRLFIIKTVTSSRLSRLIKISEGIGLRRRRNILHTAPSFPSICR